MSAMGRLNYGRVRMEIKHTRFIERKVINSDDETTFLNVQWTFDVDCAVNPQTLSYFGGPDVIDDRKGSSMTNTDWAIRRELRTHRLTLQYWVGDELLLVSPVPLVTLDAPGNAGGPPTVDSRVGPLVDANNDIIEFHGVKTMMVRFRVITWVNDCYFVRTGNNIKAVNSPKPNPIVSHRWRRYEDIDQDYFVTLITEGEAVFDAAALQLQSSALALDTPSILGPVGPDAGDPVRRVNNLPDHFRRSLFFPIPYGFQRSKINVMPSSDGTSLSYKVVDTQKPYQMDANSSVTRAECYHTEGFSEPSMLDAVFRSGPSILSSLASLRIGDAIGTAATAMFHSLPRAHSNVVCRVWGGKYASLKSCLFTAISIVLHRLTMPTLEGHPIGASAEFIATIEASGRYAEVIMTRKIGVVPELLVVADGGEGARVRIDNGIAAGLALWARAPTLEVSIAMRAPSARGVVTRLMAPSERFDSTLREPGPGDVRRASGWTDDNDSWTIAFDSPSSVDVSRGIGFNPPEDGGARGSWVVRLAHAALAEGPCVGRKQPVTPVIPSTPTPEDPDPGSTKTEDKWYEYHTFTLDNDGHPVVPPTAFTLDH